MTPLLEKSLRSLGRTLARAPAPPSAAPNRMIEDGHSLNAPRRFDRFMEIPGMLPRERGVMLYLLALGQTIAGDIIEIGSWQGRSTCFLAQACRDSGSGVVRAIDHFHGNAASRGQYVVGKDDLSDLEPNFRANIAAAGLSEWVMLYNMSSGDAVEKHGHDFADARLLFIDGDHSHEGVRHDLRMFLPRLKVGGVVVFDDYHSDGVGVVAAAREGVLENKDFGQFVQFQGVLSARRLR